MDLDYRVTIPDGKLKGTKARSIYSGISYYKFCGIPYAQPPVGALRFMPPRPPKKWTGVLHASKEKSECLQFSFTKWMITGSEDCLYLNVFTLEAPRNITELKPVLVLIFGGGHFWGDSSTVEFGCPDYFIDHDIIFVSFNYRLNVFGFLNLELPHCAGNMGLKDQNLALKWVKENIQYFGGDPNNITVHGFSSGASDLHLHMMVPKSRDLFHKGIMQCGYAINPLWSYQTNHIECAFELAREMGYKKEDAQGFLNFLKKKNALTLFLAFSSLKDKIMKRNRYRADACVFHPTIEVFKGDAFLSCSPRELMDSNNLPLKPLICSITATEGLLSIRSKPIDLLKTSFARVLQENLWMYKMNDEMTQTIIPEMKSFYFGEKEASEITISEIVDMVTDMWYCEWHDWLDSISTNPTEKPVYVYFFDHGGPMNFNQQLLEKHIPGQELKKASHGDDSGYFFLYCTEERTPSFRVHLRNSDAKIVENMTTLFTNFIRKGDPNDKKFESIQWVPHDANNPSHLHLDEELKVIPKRIFEKRAAFWHNLMKRIKTHEKEISSDAVN